jgi:hypothetical protein
MAVYPKSLSLAIQPLPFKVILIRICKFSLPTLLIGFPLPLILTPIRISLHSQTLSFAADPFSTIGAPRAEGYSGQYFLILLLHFGFDEFE